MPLDAGDGDARGGRSGGTGRATLVPALRLPRPRRHALVRRAGGRPRLRRDRSHGRRSLAGTPRARPAHRLPHPRGGRRAEHGRHGGVGGGDAARAARRDRSVADLGRPRRAARSRPAPARAEGDPDRRGRAARSRARRRRDRRLESRRPPARRRRADRRRSCPRSSRPSTAGSRSTSTAASAAAPTWSRHSRSARAPFSPAARRSGVSRPTGRRERGACSSCSRRRSSSRSRSAAARRPRRSPRRTSRRIVGP